MGGGLIDSKALPLGAAPAARREALTMRRIVHTWWPLACSWLLMTAELPLMSAVIAHMAQPEVNLAAWGIVFSLSIIIQAPSTMLLAASTALSKDLASYHRLRRYMIAIGLFLTVLHALVALTPLYDFVVGRLIGVPGEILPLARVALILMIPWSWGTAYRRFEQGVLIRFGHARAVVWGSVLRLAVDVLGLAVGYIVGGQPGVVVAAGAIVLGVVSEAVYAGWRVRPVLRDEVRRAPPATHGVTLGAFLRFYLPLALTTLLGLLVQPLVSAALTRMPDALPSLAVWPVVFGLLIMWQSVGIAYNEVVIALLEEPQAPAALRRFALLLGVASSALLLLMLLTPLASLWYRHIAALAPPLLSLAYTATWLGVLLPILRVLQSWYQGAIVASHDTGGITESVVLALVASGLILWAGTEWQQVSGIYVGVGAFAVGFALQTAWLWVRSRPALHTLKRVGG